MTDFSENHLREESTSVRDDGRNTSNIASVAVTFPVREEETSQQPVADNNAATKDVAKETDAAAQAKPDVQKPGNVVQVHFPQNETREEEAATRAAASRCFRKCRT